MTDEAIDIFQLDELNEPMRRDDFRAAMFERGVFYLEVDDALRREHQNALDVVMDLFENGTEEQKNALRNPTPHIRRGFSDLESESTAKITRSGEYTDYSMGYTVGLADNLFPSKTFEEIWTRYFNSLYSVTRQAARAVLETAGASVDEGIDSFLDCDPLLRFRYFPEVPEDRCAERQPRRMAPHYDLSIITTIQQTACANGFVSLQCDVNGTYVDLPPLPDCMVVFCGAVAALVSGGKIKAPRHQVASPPRTQRIGSSRTSSVFFLRPKPAFRFSVPLARACGLDVDLAGETATFRDWISGNYVNLRTPIAELKASREMNESPNRSSV
jgi:isopenicillin N synthase-like dioxygenase